MFHFEIVMCADAEHGYLPFREDYGGIDKPGWHCLRLGPADQSSLEAGVEESKRYALSIFPKAEIVEIWETNILGDRKGDKPVWAPASSA